MPELPEVEIVKRGIEPVLVGQVIERVVLNRPDLRFPIPEDLPHVLAGRRVCSLRRRGKYILGFVDGGDGFVLHLGMSGVIKVVQPEEVYESQKHDHVVFEMEGGGRVVFNDSRRFGSLLLCHEARWHMEPAFIKMGPEPLEVEFDGRYLFLALRRRRVTVKAALLDQAVVAGVGNIYACEALFFAGISPERIACSLSDEECELLVQAVKDVLGRAIEAGGSSLKDYRHTDGDLGYFQHQFSVYDQSGKACARCDCDVEAGGGVRRIVQSGRSSFYCPRWQA